MASNKTGVSCYIDPTDKRVIVIDVDGQISRFFRSNLAMSRHNFDCDKPDCSTTDDRIPTILSEKYIKFKGEPLENICGCGSMDHENCLVTISGYSEEAMKVMYDKIHDLLCSIQGEATPKFYRGSFTGVSGTRIDILDVSLCDDPSKTFVYMNGVLQSNPLSYSISGGGIDFVSALDPTCNLEILSFC